MIMMEGCNALSMIYGRMQQQYINQVDLKEMQKPLSHHGSSSSSSDRCRYFFPLVYRYGPLQIVYEDFSLF